MISTLKRGRRQEGPAEFTFHSSRNSCLKTLQSPLLSNMPLNSLSINLTHTHTHTRPQQNTEEVVSKSREDGGRSKCVDGGKKRTDGLRVRCSQTERERWTMEGRRRARTSWRLLKYSLCGEVPEKVGLLSPTCHHVGSSPCSLPLPINLRAEAVKLFTFLSLHLHQEDSGPWLPPLLLCTSAPVLDGSFTHICKLISRLKPRPRPHPFPSFSLFGLLDHSLRPLLTPSPSLSIPPSWIPVGEEDRKSVV